MNKTLLLSLLTTVSPLSLMAQDEKRPTDKVVKNSNIMLNEPCISQPRQIPMVCDIG